VLIACVDIEKQRSEQKQRRDQERRRWLDDPQPASASAAGPHHVVDSGPSHQPATNIGLQQTQPVEQPT